MNDEFDIDDVKKSIRYLIASLYKLYLNDSLSLGSFTENLINLQHIQRAFTDNCRFDSVDRFAITSTLMPDK